MVPKPSGRRLVRRWARYLAEGPACRVRLLEGPPCQVRFSEGPACQVRRPTFDNPRRFRGHDERAPPTRHDKHVAFTPLTNLTPRRAVR